MLKRSQEILLEAEVGKLPFFNELHRQLTQRIDSKEGNILIGIAPDLVEMLANHLPDARPLQTDATHVVVGDLDDLLQTEHARAGETGQLVQGDCTQRLDELNCLCKQTMITSHCQAVIYISFIP